MLSQTMKAVEGGGAETRAKKEAAVGERTAAPARTPTTTTATPGATTMTAESRPRGNDPEAGATAGIGRARSRPRPRTVKGLREEQGAAVVAEAGVAGAVAMGEAETKARQSLKARRDPQRSSRPRKFCERPWANLLSAPRNGTAQSQ